MAAQPNLRTLRLPASIAIGLRGRTSPVLTGTPAKSFVYSIPVAISGRSTSGGMAPNCRRSRRLEKSQLRCSWSTIRELLRSAKHCRRKGHSKRDLGRPPRPPSRAGFAAVCFAVFLRRHLLLPPLLQHTHKISQREHQECQDGHHGPRAEGLSDFVDHRSDKTSTEVHRHGQHSYYRKSP